MVTLVTDSVLEQRLRDERARTGADRYDEVWENVCVMNPLPDNEHQRLIHCLEVALAQMLEPGQSGEVFPGVNLTYREEDWQQDFRAPDVAVFLRDTRAENRGTHWYGPADFIVEIVSPNDRTREKIPFYQSAGVRELLVIDRQPWMLELYRWKDGELPLAERVTLASPQKATSQVLSCRFGLVRADPRPHIEIVRAADQQRWVV